MPSLVCVGGIRMSVSTASGEVSATALISESSVGRHRHDLDLLDLGQQRGDSLTDQVVVVGDDDAKRHASTVAASPRREVVLTRATGVLAPSRACCQPHRAGPAPLPSVGTANHTATSSTRPAMSRRD